MVSFYAFISAALLVGSVAADYHCSDNLGKFTIKSQWAVDARTNGGKTTGKSGFPHEFHGGSGSGKTQLKFYGADPRCNEKNPKLFEYPVLKDGKKYDKEGRHGQTKTPARVVYLQADETLCGVMTHVIEDKHDNHGSGDFRVCDRA